MALETFILQFETSEEPNEFLCASIKLDLSGGYRFKTINSVTAADIYEIITDKRLWNQEETENEQND